MPGQVRQADRLLRQPFSSCQQLGSRFAMLWVKPGAEGRSRLGSHLSLACLPEGALAEQESRPLLYRTHLPADKTEAFLNERIAPALVETDELADESRNPASEDWVPRIAEIIRQPLS